MPNKFTQLVDKTRSVEDPLLFLREESLILNGSVFCEDCGSRMLYESGQERHEVNMRYRCSLRSCKRTLSPFKGSLFEGLRIRLQKALYIMYYKALKQPLIKIANQLDIDPETVSKFITKMVKSVDSTP